MWCINEDGEAVCLDKAELIFLEEDNHKFPVRANFTARWASLKTFTNENDAKKYIAELVEKLNAEKQ